MIHLIAITLCAFGFLALGATQKRHQRAVFRRALTKEEIDRGRLAGGAILAIALGLDSTVLGAGLGTIAWTGHLSLGAGFIVITIHRLSAR